MNTSKCRLLFWPLLLALLSACSQEPSPPPPAAATEAAEPARNSGPLIVQSSRPPQQMIPVLDGWRSETGGRFELVTEVEGEVPPAADFIVTGSLAETWDLAETDEFRPVFSETITDNIDAALRDSEQRWTALSRRARVIVYNEDRISAADLAAVQSYEALREQRWREQLCLSSSKVAGNRLLVALMISRHDLREAELIVREWRGNLAAPVFMDDDALLTAVEDGTCAIGIANSNDAQSAGINMHWFDDPGATLVDVTTASLSRHATSPAKAQELIEWLVTETPNALFAIQDLELPANAASPAGNLVASYAAHVDSSVPLSNLGFLIEEADRLNQRARYP